jgi:hypothetical protein
MKTRLLLAGGLAIGTLLSGPFTTTPIQDGVRTNGAKLNANGTGHGMFVSIDEVSTF